MIINKKLLLPILGVVLFMSSLLIGKSSSSEAGKSFQQTISPERIVNQQIASYNKRDIAGFLATYHDSITIQYFPNRVVSKGKVALRNTYEPMFANLKFLEAKIGNRIIHGSKVIDYETAIMTGEKRSDTLTVVVVYEIKDNLIHRVTFIQ